MSGDIAKTQLAGTRADVGAGRRFVRQALEDWGIEALAEPAALVTSELVTNVVLHARTAVDMTVRLTDDRVRIEVADGSPALPRVRSFGQEAATGRGLHLVAAMGSAWGVDPTGAGKIVWVELTIEPESRDTTPRSAVDLDLDALEALGGWDEPGEDSDGPQARVA